jgi:hypothetical protein
MHLRGPKMTEEDINIISSYSCNQAAEDGFLISVDDILKQKGLFNFITIGFWDRYGLDKAAENLKANLIDLLNQAREIIRKRSKDFKVPDWFYCGYVENMTGKKIKIFIEQNETGRYTILLPEEH